MATSSREGRAEGVGREAEQRSEAEAPIYRVQDCRRRLQLEDGRSAARRPWSSSRRLDLTERKEWELLDGGGGRRIAGPLRPSSLPPLLSLLLSLSIGALACSDGARPRGSRHGISRARRAPSPFLARASPRFFSLRAQGAAVNFSRSETRASARAASAQPDALVTPFCARGRVRRARHPDWEIAWMTRRRHKNHGFVLSFK